MKNLLSSATRRPQSALVPLCLAGMDACWVFAVAWLFDQVVLAQLSNFSLPPAFVLGAFELGGWGLMLYLLDRTTFSTGSIRAVMGVVGLILASAVALALNPFDIVGNTFIWAIALSFAAFISLSLWILGAYRVTERARYEDIYSAFRLGLVAMSAAALLSTVLANKRVNDLWSELGGIGLWFFVFGLAGLALGNREEVRRETGNVGMKSWGWMVAASVGAILLLGEIGQASSGKDLLSTLQDVVLGIVAAVAVLLYAILYAILWPLSLFNVHLGPLGTLPLPTPTPTSAKNSNPIADLQKHRLGVGAFQVPPELQTLFLVLGAAVVVVVVLYFMTMWLRRTRPDRPQLETEERVRFGSWSLLLAQIKAWLLRLLARFRKHPPPTTTGSEDDLASLLGRPELAGTLSVRQIYSRLLRLAGSAGYPRALYQTPTEYSRFLSRALPDLRSDLQDITAAYLEARYSSTPPSQRAVQAAMSAWQRAEPLLVAENVKRKM